MNADESANRLVGQLEIYRMPSPRWVPDAWAHQALLDRAQARLLPPQREWMGKILVCSKVFCTSTNVPRRPRGRLAQWVRKIEIHQGQVSISLDLLRESLLARQRGPGRYSLEDRACNPKIPQTEPILVLPSSRPPTAHVPQQQ